MRSIAGPVLTSNSIIERKQENMASSKLPSAHPSAKASASDTWQSSRGVTMIELLIVVAIIAIVSSFAVIQFSRTQESYNADNAAYKILNYCREASSRAVSDHHSYRVVINTNTNYISLINENTNDLGTGNGEGATVAGDDVLVKSEPVGTRVTFTQPTGTSLPPSPYNYAAATFTGGVWTAHFMSDGSVVDPFSTTGNPLSCTIFVSPSDLQGQLPLVRAVTVFSSSSSVKFWLCSASGTFVQG